MIEVQRFRLVAGTDEAAFLEADRAVQNEFIPNLPGFARRTTARGDNGEWIVITLWDWPEAADDAARLAETHPATRAFAALIDGVEVGRYNTLD